MVKERVFNDISDKLLVQKLSKGDTVKCIAMTYKIDIRRLEYYLLKLRRKYDCNSIAALITHFIKNEMI